MELSSFAQRWQRLNDWLVHHRELWQPTPFTQPEPKWAQQMPTVADRVGGLSDDDCRYYENDPLALALWLAPELPSLAEYSDLTFLPALVDESGAEACTLPEVRARDMPGRKRRQSGAFVAAVRPLTAPVIDWCCGKGHLGRTLLPFCDQTVTGLEWDSSLVDDGNRLARKSGDAMTLHCQDVMSDELSLTGPVHGVALHACGDLHRRLMVLASEERLPRLSLSPCCFHLSSGRDYEWMSEAARKGKNTLAVTTADMRLAVEETVTAPARVRDQVQTFSQWRLGFDGLQRWLRGVDDYLPVPSHPGRIKRGDFRQFCHWAADKKGLVLPGDVSFDHWQAYGVRRLAEVRRHELVRHLFRRPMELWLVLDYAVFLEEQGYRVRLGEFCRRELTPRNLLIDAVIDD